ncbi:beta-ketoacyl-ACP reductase [Streptomyces ruber]|uniref:Beta-ketoacyl-ACP reductase n=2 Tax=Streptomyces TaxID=1883 RepID=A0A918EV72_9ACTN|nr:SDR family NAD(P)-dependent oxidoreductase [Streptomyces ruber]GGQ72983.1 beta-ketoacyl-ACP reductase [Streptomyces ruber]
MDTAARSAPAGPGQAVRRLEGAVALVTGGCSSVGRAVCRRLAAEGALVRVADATEQPPGRPGAPWPYGIGLSADLSDPVAVERAVLEVVAADGRIDVLVNCPGIMAGDRLWDVTPGQWARALETSLTGVFHVCRAVLPHMASRRRGSVVNVASETALTGRPGHASGCAVSAAILGLSRAAALDGAPSGVRVNCVCPAVTGAAPEAVASAVAWLVSPESLFVTGVALPVGTTSIAHRGVG